ncbi:MAG TPA: N-acetylmuramoyl-L-alanine amidase [Fimbriimonas sp.]|nr:N-acetylmuramoyl-L-alanine amidase [Fimbriimonas sp.]
MKRLLGILALGMAISTNAVAQNRVASTSYTFKDAPLRGYRVGDEFYLPLDVVTDLGWAATAESSTAKLYAENNILDLSIRQVAGKACFPLREAIQKLGGTTSWNPGGYDHLQISSSIYNVSVRAGMVTVESTLAVKPTVSLLGSSKVVIDLDGAKLPAGFKVDSDGNATVSQYGANAVRIVCNIGFAPNLPNQQLPSAAKLKIDLTQPIGVQPSVPPEFPNQGVAPAPGTPFELPLKLDSENATNSSMSIKFAPGQWKGTAAYRKPEPDILEITLSSINCTLPQGFYLDSKAVKDISIRTEATNTVVRFKLDRAMGADVVATATGVTINLVRPIDTDGRLNGKVIVLDAGHGGRDNGATAGGAMEKNINLFLTRFVRDALTAEGATVIMTRNDDSFPSLESRPALANKSKADIFISIHANMPGSNSNPSGTITFYHKGSAISKFLGECIHNDLASKKLLPNLGVKSDGTLYNSGLAVLRLSKMPGVLIESGFVSNSKDRAMIQSKEFGEALAKSVVKGLKIYYGQ